MSLPAPTLGQITPQHLASAMGQLGLPTPVSVIPMAPPWMHQNYRLRWAPEAGIADQMLRRVVGRIGALSLEREQAALTLARTIEGLPVAGQYAVLPPGLLPWPAAISSILPGVPASRWLRTRPEELPAVAADIGRLVLRLEAQPQGRFGTHADGGHFVAARASWAEEGGAQVGRAIESARAAGASLGALSDGLEDRVRGQLSALTTASRWSLIHGDLHLNNLLYAESDTSTLTGLIDWEASMVGDPLVEWAQLLDRGPEQLAWIWAGYGAERARAVLDDADAVARLEVYVWTRCLNRLAVCSSPLMHGESGARRTHALEHARRMARQWREPAAVRARLEASLAPGAAAVQVPPATGTDPANRVIWRALESLRHHPLPPARSAGVFACALAASALAAPRLGEDRHGGGWIEVGIRAVEQLGPQIEPAPAEPIADRASWSRALHATLVRASAERSTALSCWWLALEGLDRLAEGDGDWPVGDPLLRNLETWLRAVLVADSDKAPLPPASRCLHAILGLAARLRLAELDRALGAEDVDAVRETLLQTWEDLTIFGEGVAGPVDPAAYERAWAERNADGLEDPVIGPALILALRLLADELPASQSAVLGALGGGP